MNATPLRSLVMRILYEKPLLPQCQINPRVWREYPCSENAIATELWRLKLKGMVSKHKLVMSIDKSPFGWSLTDDGKQFYEYYFMK